MRIPSGVTDQYVYFVAVDATDLTTRETGLSSWTVYRSRNGGAAAAMTTPTINETDATNMPGVYELLLDEDMTIGSGNDSEEMAFHITHAGMHPVTRTIELYRPKITAGETATVSSGTINSAVQSIAANAITATAIASNAITAAKIATDAITAAKIAADAIGASELAADAVAEIADAVWDEDATGHQTGGTFGQAIGDPGANTETMYDAVVTDAAGTNVAADVIGVKSTADAIETDTQDLQTQVGTAGAGLTDLGGMSTTMKGQVNAEADTALTDYDAVVPADLPTNFGDLSISATTGRVDVASIEGSDATDQINAAVDTAFTTQMADSVASDGSIPTREQALLMITRFLFESSVSSTTVTVKKEDGSTSSMTFTINDDTNPSSITRSG